VELWKRLPAEAQQGTELSTVPPPPNSRVLTGVVSSLSCDEKEKTMTVVIDGDSRTLRMKEAMMVGFSDTLWFGGDHFDNCHHLEGLRVAIHYDLSSNQKVHGTLLKMSVFNNLFP